MPKDREPKGKRPGELNPETPEKEVIKVVESTLCADPYPEEISLENPAERFGAAVAAASKTGRIIELKPDGKIKVIKASK